MQAAPSINLVKNKKPRVLDQFIHWALTVGRVVVILTEAVALGAFLYRFGLDRQLIDLHDKIAQEQNIVKFLKTSEDTYRSLQNRIALADSLITQQDDSISRYDGIISLVPSDMVIKSLSFSANTLRIEATVQSIIALTNFIQNLRQYPGIATVSLDKIENKTSLNIISAGITATFKNTGGKTIQ